MDFFAEIDKATEDWKLAHGIRNLYTHRKRYQSGFREWIAFDDDKWPDGPVGHGRTEEEAIEDLRDQLTQD